MKKYLNDSQKYLQLIFGAAIILTATAFTLENAFGAIPCEMCWWQRYIHWAIGAAALVGLYIHQKSGFILTFLLSLLGLGIAIWQVLAQNKILPLPESCKGGDALLAQGADLLISLQNAQPLPPCDEVNFTIFGLSLAAWNIPTMLGFLILSLYAIKQKF